jgi:hypothetical protein
MLSTPPARFAARTSRSAAFCGVGLASTIAWIWSSVTIPVRPSLHRSSRSPSSSTTESSSTWTSSSVPSDRVMTFLCGCTSASAFVISPDRTIRATSV